MSAESYGQRTPTRGRILMIAGALTLLATAWAALEPDEAPVTTRRVADPTTTSAAASRRALPASTTALAGTWPEAPTAYRRSAWQSADPKGVVAWGPPPAPAPPPAAPQPKAPAPAAPPPAPQPPPFPYTLIGRLDDGESRALLTGPLRSFGVKATDVIDGQWRVDAVQPQGVTLTWLPGGTQKTLAFSSS